MKYLVFLCLCCAMSCSPQKKLDRLVKKYPELLFTDSIHYNYTLIDTVVLKALMIDTFFVSKELDSFFVFNENLSSLIIRKQDTLFVKTSFTPDTVYINKTIPLSFPYDRIKYIQSDKIDKLIAHIPYISLAIFAIVIAALFFSKRK